jgi:hypothetical protein
MHLFSEFTPKNKSQLVQTTVEEHSVQSGINCRQGEHGVMPCATKVTGSGMNEVEQVVHVFSSEHLEHSTRMSWQNWQRDVVEFR